MISILGFKVCMGLHLKEAAEKGLQESSKVFKMHSRCVLVGRRGDKSFLVDLQFKFSVNRYLFRETYLK